MRPETPQNRPQYHRLRRIVAMMREGMVGVRLLNRSDFRRELVVARNMGDPSRVSQYCSTAICCADNRKLIRFLEMSTGQA